MVRSNKNITGKLAEHKLEEAGITTNKNMIPYDKKSPFITSGIRIGTPAVTSRGMGDNAMKSIAHYMHQTIEHIDNESVLREIKTSILELTKEFPLYPDWS